MTWKVYDVTKIGPGEYKKKKINKMKFSKDTWIEKVHYTFQGVTDKAQRSK